MATLVVGGMVLIGFIFILLVLWRLIFGRQSADQDAENEHDKHSTFSAIRNLTRSR
jgi:hypothetical protein